MSRSKPKLDQYIQSLTASQIAEGMNASHRNAKRLVEDAKLLLENGRCASAVACAILSIEESGKSPILRALALARNQQEVKKHWREYRTHTSKNMMWIIAQLFAQGATKATDFLPMFDQDSEHPYLLDQLKQLCFYTDCLASAHWSEPQQVASRELAETLIHVATGLSSGREVTLEEIELWIQHLQPAWQTSNSAMEKALFEWDQDMRKRSLVSNSSPTMEGFFKQGFVRKAERS
jgi:AbiV family abortive infection protein